MLPVREMVAGLPLVLGVCMVSLCKRGFNPGGITSSQTVTAGDRYQLPVTWKKKKTVRNE